jgi:hypothetical protein
MGAPHLVSLRMGLDKVRRLGLVGQGRTGQGYGRWFVKSKHCSLFVKDDEMSLVTLTPGRRNDFFDGNDVDVVFVVANAVIIVVVVAVVVVVNVVVGLRRRFEDRSTPRSAVYRQGRVPSDLRRLPFKFVGGNLRTKNKV